jgi:hypothetical protein
MWIAVTLAVVAFPRHGVPNTTSRIFHVAAATRYQMHMTMENRLTGTGTVIDAFVKSINGPVLRFD